MIHAGIYYAKGSLKAKLCVSGAKRIYEYCDEKNIPYKKVGKLIIATDESECQTLDQIFERAQANACDGIRMVDGREAVEIEPAVSKACLKAIWSPNTGIIDWAEVTAKYVEETLSLNPQSKLFLAFEVQSLVWDDREQVVLVGGQRRPVSGASVPGATEYSGSGPIKAKFVVTAGGLWSDKLAQLTGCSKDPTIVPFRGEFLVLKAGTHTIKTNIYPVPDVRFPFLGVHVTPRMDGSVYIGPNAVFAFSRSGYKMTDVNVSDLFTSITHPGFRKLAVAHWQKGLTEFYQSINRSSALKQIQKLVPCITESSLLTAKESGVRAQAMTSDGLLDDFTFDTPPEDNGLNGRVIHVRNAPSPAATSSLSIGQVIGDRVIEMIGLQDVASRQSSSTN